jgi:predicted hydrocarbon binding protein
MGLIFKGKKNLVGYDIILLNKPGALKFAASIPEKYGLNIVYFDACGISEEYGNFFLVVDFTDKDTSPQILLDEFRKNKEYIMDANMSPTLYDIIYPSRFCIKDIGGMRAILFLLGNMMGIIQGIKTNLGKREGESLLYHLGFGVGKEIYRIHAEPRGIQEVEDAVKLIVALCIGGGWGDVLDYEIKDKKIIVRVDKLWECEIQKEGPASHYVRGILGGFFSQLLKKRVAAVETKCIAAGDPYCQFEITIIG